MDKGKNIEDIFRKAAENYKVQPGKQVWENVEKEMWNKNFFNNLNEILKKYQVQPSVQVWSNIQSKLKFLMFFRFSWNSFNIYYASFLLIAASGLFMFSDFGSNELSPSKLNGITENQSSAFEIQPVREISDNINIPENTRANITAENLPERTRFNRIEEAPANNTTAYPVLNNNTEKTTTQTVSENPIVNNENTVNENVVVVEDKGKVVFAESFIKRTGKTAGNADLVVSFDKVLSSKIKVKNSIPVKNNDLIADKSIKQVPVLTAENVAKEANIAVDERKSTEIPVSKNNQTEKQTDVVQIKSESNEPVVKVAEIVVAEVIPVDEMYKDTVGKDAAGNDIIIETTHWSADVYWSPVRTINRYAAANSESQRYSALLDGSDKPVINTTSFGFNANYSFKQLLVQTGISYTAVECQNSVSVNTQTFNPYTAEAVFPTTDFTVNEYTFLDLDSLIAGVDYPITVYDTVWSHSTDTFQYVAYDTINSIAALNSYARYSWVEIPVIVGFEFERPKYTVTPKVGLIAGYLKGYGGTTISRFDNSKIMDVSAGMPLNKINLSAYFAVGFAYKISGRFEAIADPYLRYNLNSIFRKESSVSQKLYGAGVKVGLRYYFN